MEERCHGLLSRCPFLHIVDDEHVDGLIEMDEVVDGILAAGITELHLEEAGRHVQHALLRVHLLTLQSDGIHQMRLSASRRTIEEEGIERRLARMLGNAETYRARQLVGVTLNEGMERLVNVQLGIEVPVHRVHHRR